MTTGLRAGSRQPFNTAHVEFRKELWKKALASQQVTMDEVKQAALDPESRTLLLVSLKLAGIKIIP